MKIAVCISGASGAIYAKRLIENLKEHELFIVISEIAKKIFKDEIGIEFDEFMINFKAKIYDNKDFSSPLASGSFKIDACVVVPCSVKSLSAIASGYAENLISRCADVCIKEKRKLILLVREMPFSSIHLENMLKLSNLGVTIMPPCPGFYYKPKTIEDLVDFVVGRILDQLSIENNLFKRWGW
ncbi:UbiX family flavin prenyltransferase [Hippea maritima]|uniref:Flavin prenyltransferase UbiX n=1 Tax=Hippea maritima (strain ATCC 700847 / DSM 10411 / MH2) TaxID=760142 RepID=F2LVB2_HIPMA|nr:UbiX family flavin prenyltransferase [Hippea maritima]AEA33696.1 3-octaprenyl-4-hydroxybenzoate carboxy-lyase [Hippea maritima DSM 10411]